MRSASTDPPRTGGGLVSEPSDGCVSLSSGRGLGAPLPDSVEPSAREACAIDPSARAHPARASHGSDHV